MTTNDIRKFLTESIQDLLKDPDGVWYKYLGNNLYLVTGWSGDNELCSKIAVNTSSLQSDYETDFIFPYYQNGDIYDTEWRWTDEGIPYELKKAKFDERVEQIVYDFENLRKLDIDDDGKIIEHTYDIIMYENDEDFTTRTYDTFDEAEEEFEQLTYYNNDHNYKKIELVDNATGETLDEVEAQLEQDDEDYKDNLEENLNMDKLDKAYNGSYYTITGVGGDINEWKEGYQDLLNKENIGQIKEWIEFIGKDMNDKYNLNDENKYQDDLHFLAFPLDGLDANKLATFKLRMQDRWFDDIVDNNARFNDNEDFDESIKTVKGIKRKQSMKEDSNDEPEDISHIIFDGYYDGESVGELTVVARDDIDLYHTLIKDVDGAEKFNYHSDYWGSDEDYQRQNVDLMDDLSPYIGKKVQIDYDSGSLTGKLLGIAVDRGYNDIHHTQVVLDSIEEVLEENSENISKLKEDIEREFTIFFNREGFEYGNYGAVRIKATNEDEAEEKFYANNKDDKIHVTSIRPTENEDIRKGIRLMEEYKNPIKIDDVEDKARQAVDPSYAKALKDRKKFNKITDKKVSADLDNVLNKKFTLDNMKKYTLDESLFESVDKD